jgi:hypothetical protein
VEGKILPRPGPKVRFEIFRGLKIFKENSIFFLQILLDSLKLLWLFPQRCLLSYLQRLEKKSSPVEKPPSPISAQ